VKITEVEAIPLVLPHHAGVWYAGYTGGAVGKADVILVKVTCSDGTMGLGDVKYYSSGVEGKHVPCIINEEIGPRLVGEDPLQGIEKIHEIIDSVLSLGPSGARRNPQARDPLISAIYDIRGKVFNVPAYELLGGCYAKEIPILPRAYIGVHTRFRARGYITQEMGHIELRIKAEADRKAGFTHGYAIKVGGLRSHIDTFKAQRSRQELDVESVRIVREIMGNDEETIYADANQAWDTKTAIWMIKEMEKYGPIVMEQPVAAWDLNAMAEVTRAVKSPVMADSHESCWSFVDLRNILEKRAADIIVLRSDTCGGIDNMKLMGQIAEKFGISCTCACTATGIGMAANAHCVASTRNILMHPSQLNGPMELADDIIKGGPLTYKNGLLKVPERPGLGVELDEKKVEKYRVEI